MHDISDDILKYTHDEALRQIFRAKPCKQVRHTSDRIMQEWEYSAKVLIDHYRAILKAMVPFASAWDEKRKREMKLHTDIDDNALEYMRCLSTMIQA